MKIKLLIWTAAVLLTLFSALFQRLTGPTYPLKGRFTWDGKDYAYKFPRTHAGAGGQIVAIPLLPQSDTAQLVWKRYKTNDEWTRVEMQRQSDVMTAELPHQPPAGKLEYHIEIRRGDEILLLPVKENVVIRFRNDVPAWALIPHILLMFFAMLFSTATGLSALTRSQPLAGKIKWTLVLLFAGGFIFGPLVQKFAFGEWWTGFPLGTDLTDNKTLIAFLVWLGAGYLVRRNPQRRFVVVAAAVVTLIVFMIPHSLHGSELDYSKLEKEGQAVVIRQQE
ncbi:MAG: hypothetical protein ONA69_07675 [candidate division KSB1 bacterium]|nr:hypothetical protein [candidate division KSB1 bacterium]MDZ7346658.1 hypothetical protein [candidate division KSB1 bacterium]